MHSLLADEGALPEGAGMQHNKLSAVSHQYAGDSTSPSMCSTTAVLVDNICGREGDHAKSLPIFAARDRAYVQQSRNNDKLVRCGAAYR
jgi:hypothetical protein